MTFVAIFPSAHDATEALNELIMEGFSVTVGDDPNQIDVEVPSYAPSQVETVNQERYAQMVLVVDDHFGRVADSGRVI